jgi:acyl carrier protein
MNEEMLFNTLKDILKNDVQLQIEITKDTALLSEQLIDSLDFMNYVTVIEEKFSIAISDTDISANKLGIIQNMIDFITAKTSK